MKVFRGNVYGKFERNFSNAPLMEEERDFSTKNIIIWYCVLPDLFRNNSNHEACDVCKFGVSATVTYYQVLPPFANKRCNRPSSFVVEFTFYFRTEEVCLKSQPKGGNHGLIIIGIQEQTLLLVPNRLLRCVDPNKKKICTPITILPKKELLMEPK